jgi:hypothetical protein
MYYLHLIRKVLLVGGETVVSPTVPGPTASWTGPTYLHIQTSLIGLPHARLAGLFEEHSVSGDHVGLRLSHYRCLESRRTECPTRRRVM